MKLINRILRAEGGATAAEYTLILAIVGSALAIAALLLGGTIGNSMDRQSTIIETCGDGTC
jgi:pilus assembly protein Flp/PilA